MKVTLRAVMVRTLLISLLGPALVAGEDPPVFLRKWGSKGSGNGQFVFPRGIALDSSRNVYVVEVDNNRVQKFTPEGVFVRKWGTWGTNDGQFRYPQMIAIDAQDTVYVVDRANDRIQKFSTSGMFLGKWGTPGTGDGQFHYPFDIAVDDCGFVYTTEDSVERVQKFTSDGTFVAKWGTHGTGNGQFEYPFGIEASGCDHVYVTDDGNNRRLQKFTPTGGFVWKLGGYGTGDGKFIDPMGIAVDSSGNVYVADLGNHRIQKFSPEGVFLTKWGTQGTGDGQFNYPTGIVVDPEGNVYVTDTGNSRVQVFGPANHPPVAEGQSVQTPGNTPVVITLSGSDPDHDPLTYAIGDPPVHGILNGAPPLLTYLPNANFIGEDSFTFTVNDGKVHSAPAAVTINVYDHTAPVILDPVVAGTLGNNGWYTSAVSVQWTASDPESGIVAPCPATTLSIDTTGTPVTCTVTNGAGLTASRTITLRVDQTPPSVTYAGNEGTYTADQMIAITCTASDATSGIASSTCTGITGPAYSFNLGPNSYSATATDHAGNQGSGSTSFTVTATPGATANLTQQFVTNPGVAGSMVAKLEAAAQAAARGNANAKAGALNAFINQINAQTGKSLTAEQAAILIRLALAL